MRKSRARRAAAEARWPARRQTIETDLAERPSRDSRATGRNDETRAWCRRDNDGSNVLLGRRHPSIDFLDRLSKLRTATVVGGRFELAFQLGPGQPQRFERLNFLRILDRLAALLAALPFQFLHAFLNSRIRINQSLARITHQSSPTE